MEVPNTMKINGVSLLDYAGESEVVKGVRCKIYEAREGYKEKRPKASDSNMAVPIIIQCFIWIIGMSLMVLSVKYWKWWTLLSFIPILNMPAVSPSLTAL